MTILILMYSMAACGQHSDDTSGKADRDQNLLEQIDPSSLSGLRWLNKPERFERTGNSLEVIAATETDFFNSPEDESITATAPLLYKEVEGDFIATAHVRPDFSSVWNAAALMIHSDSANWIKFAFENSDATGKSIVSVVTKGTSDDANGPVLQNEESVWLRIIRKGNIFSLHWSKDGVNFKMARIAAMPVPDLVKVGLEAQCPVGEPAKHEFLYFSIEKRTVNDMRAGK